MIWHEFGKPASRDGSIELCVYVLLTLTGTYSYKVLILFVCLIYFFFHDISFHDISMYQNAIMSNAYSDSIFRVKYL